MVGTLFCQSTGESSPKYGASIKVKIALQNFDKVKVQFLLHIKVVCEMDDIPGDQTMCQRCGVIDNGEEGAKMVLWMTSGR